MTAEPQIEQPDTTRLHEPARRNRALLRDFFEQVYGCGATPCATLDTTRIAGCIADRIADDVQVHDPFMGAVCGAGAFLQLHKLFEAAFRRERVTLHDINADGDFVSVYYTYHGQHTGRYIGLPATGRPVCLACMDLYRLCNGKIVEVWRRDLSTALLVQLDIVPSKRRIAG